MCINQNNTQLYTITSKNNLIIFELQTFKIIKEMEPEKIILQDLILSKKENQILAATDIGCIILYDSKNLTKLITLNGHSDKVNILQLSKDGKIFLSAGIDKTIIAWDAEKYEILFELKGHINSINTLII